MEKAGAEIRPQFLLDLALARALSGDPAGAEAMAPAIFSSPDASEYPTYVRPLFDGIVAWKKGELDVAADRLRIAPGIPYVDPRYKALTVLGEVELARGRNEAAIAALEQARAIGFTPVRVLDGDAPGRPACTSWRWPTSGSGTGHGRASGWTSCSGSGSAPTPTSRASPRPGP